MMKILSPIDDVEEVEELVEAGADELYCGLVCEEWLSRYDIVAINRRPAKRCNLKSFNDLKKITDVAHSHRVPISVTINEHYYLREQHPLLLEYAKKLADIGVDSLLIADPALILALSEANIKVDIHLSTGITILNSEAIRFFADLGVSRVTFERHMRIDEIRKAMENISNINIETCVFILNSRCPNIDGLCTFNHFSIKCPEPQKLLGERWNTSCSTFAAKDPMWTNACMLPFHVSASALGSLEGISTEETDKTKAAVVRQEVWDRYHTDELPCGVCALYDLEEMGISYAKIVGRGNQTKRKIDDVRVVRFLLSLLKYQKVSSKEEFRRVARSLHVFPCRTTTCYYPEMMPQERILE